MNKKLQEGDLLIKRVDNGWVVISCSKDNELHESTSVYQDPNDTNDFNFSSASSLTSCIKEIFVDFLQTKKTAGFTITCHEKGYE